MCGTHIVVETPGPIPNPAVKHDGANGRATESRKVPRKLVIKISNFAQLHGYLFFLII